MSNAIQIKQRLEQKKQEAHKRTVSEQYRQTWKKKTDMLAFRANLRYDRANNAAEQAEMRIESRMRRREQNQVERKGQGIAAILSQGNYNQPSRQVRDLSMHHEGGCAVVVHAPKNRPVGLTSLANGARKRTAS